MDAVISDIHGNLEALEAVLAQIHCKTIHQVICLGDVVGYGPDSLECVRRSSTWERVVAGVFDREILGHTKLEWNSYLKQHLKNLRADCNSAADSNFLLATLSSYQPSFADADVHFAHGSPRDFRDYIFPEIIYETDSLECLAKYFPLQKTCVCGGSHVASIFRRVATQEWEHTKPEPGVAYDLSESNKAIVVCGSVGQPRDEDPRASFLTLDERSVTFHRVEYDVEKTIGKIAANPVLDNMFGERLRSGR